MVFGPAAAMCGRALTSEANIAEALRVGPTTRMMKPKPVAFNRALGLECGMSAKRRSAV